MNGELHTHAHTQTLPYVIGDTRVTRAFTAVLCAEVVFVGAYGCFVGMPESVLSRDQTMWMQFATVLALLICTGWIQEVCVRARARACVCVCVYGVYGVVCV